MAQPIPIGTATGRSDHRTNTGQLQQTTTLRMCRAQTTHRHRVGNHVLKTHPVTSGRDAVTFTRQSRNTFSSVHRRPMSLVQRLGIAAFVVVITGVGLSPAAEALSAHHHHLHHSRKNKKKKAYSRGYKHGYRRAIENSYRPHYRTHHRSYSPLYGPWFHRCPGASSSPQHPGWFRFTLITTAPESTSDLGSTFRQSPIHNV